LSFFSDAVCGDNLIPSGDFEASSEEWKADMGIERVFRVEFDEKHAGDASLGLQYSAWVLSPELVEIEPDGIYRLSAFFKRPKVATFGSESQKITFQLALWMYDAEDNLIGGMAVEPVKGTETKLTAEATEGSTELRVEGEPWKRKTISGLAGGIPFDAIAFDVHGDYSDLPNRASYMIESISEDNGGALIRLRKPLKQAYPVGTQVRQHAAAEVIQVGGVPSPEWTESFVEVSGMSEPGKVAADKFWPGTKKVRIAIRAHGSEGPEVDLLVDDVTLLKN